MGESNISFQVDECFIKSVRNASKRRREHSAEKRFENVKDFYKEFVRLGLIIENDETELDMKKKVIRKLIGK